MKYIVLVLTILLILFFTSRQISQIKHENDQIIRKLQQQNDKLRRHQKRQEKTKPIEIKLEQPKPEEPRHIERLQKIRISSSDRDTERFPKASDFEIKLPSTIRNIKSIELSKFSMSRSAYIVDDFNSKMIIRDITSDAKHIINLKHGFYSIGTYIKELNRNFSVLDIDLRVSFNAITNNTTIENMGSDSTYKVLYQTEEFEDSNFNLLGFMPEDFTLYPGEHKVGTRRVDMFGATNLSLELKNVSYGYDDNILANILIKENMITTYENNNERPRREINPLLNLKKIAIRTTFKPPYKQRREYEFNGINFSAVLEIVTLERKMPFEQIITKYN